MKLTKERCLNALDVMCNECDEESAEILSQLIDEHFDNEPVFDFALFEETIEKIKNEPLKPAVGVYEVREIRKLEEEIALLKRENKALADDNEMKCEKISKLNKRIERLLEGGRIMSDAVDELTEEKERLERMLETFK